MFMAQRPFDKLDKLPAESGPMVYVANEMTPFSSEDVTVYSNCEEVRLTVFENGKKYVYQRSTDKCKMPSPIITFKDAFHFMELKALARSGKRKEAYILTEGLVNGKIVVTNKKYPSWRPVSLRLRVDDDGLPLHADGSDVVTLIAEIVDEEGTVKRLNNTSVRFTVTGEATLLGDCDIACNPVPAHWGSAPVLIRATTNAGKINIRAEVLGEGVHAIVPCEFEYKSVKPVMRFIYNPVEVRNSAEKKVETRGTDDLELSSMKEEILRLKRRISKYELREVELQQESFGEKK